MNNIKLYITSTCPYCKGPKNYINENNLDVEIVDVTKFPEKKDEIIKIGRKLQVPMLSINNEPMYESLDILDWLKENL